MPPGVANVTAQRFRRARDQRANLLWSDRGCVEFPNAGSEREWRNRQTRTVQVRVSERTWGFNSPLAHSGELASDLGLYTSGRGPSSSKVLEGLLSLSEAGGEAVHGRPLHGRGDVGSA